jgi:hypothetical protein
MPQGQRSRGRPRCTWKRTYETEQKDANRTGLEIENMAQDRIEWCQLILPYVPLGAMRIDDEFPMGSMKLFYWIGLYIKNNKM